MYMYGNKKEPETHSQAGTGRKYDGFIRYRNTSIFLCIVIISGYFLFFRGNLKATVYVEFQDTQIELTTWQGDDVIVPYDTITSVELADTVDFGDPTEDGYDNVRGTGGIWESDTYGTYRLLTTAKAKDYIVLTTTGETVIFNYESTDTTDSIYTGLEDLLESDGYTGISYTSYLN